MFLAQVRTERRSMGVGSRLARNRLDTPCTEKVAQNENGYLRNTEVVPEISLLARILQLKLQSDIGAVVEH